MMKKLICLVLAMLMVVPLLASCGGDEDAVDNITSDASQYTTTLNMWVVTDSYLVAQASERVREGYVPEDVPADNLPEGTVLTEKQQIVDQWSSDEQDAFLQVYAVEEAINKLTKSKFKTRIKLFYLHSDNYYEGIEQAFNDHQAAIDDGSYQSAGQNTSEETVIVDGIPQLKYPETQDYVIDILYLDGYDRYRSYVDMGWLKDMTTLLDTDAVEIGKYINNAFLQAVKYNNFTYAIPNYHGVEGQYTYLMINNDLFAEYGRVPADILSGSIYDGECKNVLDYIYQDKDSVYPIYTDNADGSVDFGPVYYWSHETDGTSITINKDRFSIFGDVFADSAVKGQALSYDSLLADQEYMDTLALKRYYESNAGYVTSDPAQRFSAAACVVHGNWELREEYEAQGYSVFVMETPRVTTDDVFGSMFAIGGKTGYANRAMSIIAYLNTNSEIRNLLQYGIQDVNYTLETAEYTEGGETKHVEYLVATGDNFYEMNVNKTGNVFLAYTEMDANEIKHMTGEEIAQAVLAKSVSLQKKNKEALTDLTLGLYYSYTSVTGTYALDVESINIITAVSARVEAAIATMTKEDINALYALFSASKADLAETASKMIATFGDDITYTVGDEVKTVTVESLTEALDCMADTQLVDDTDKPNNNDNDKESPNAFYQAWLAAVNAGY